LAGAVGVGRSGVCAWETFTVIQELSQLPGIARIGIDFLRIGRAADMPHEASSPTLTQRHTLGVANADSICAAGIPTFAGISDQVILAGNPQTVCEASQGAFVRISYGIEFYEPPWNPDMDHEASSPDVIITPSVTIVDAEQGHTSTEPSRLVNHIIGVANATMPFLAGNSGFGRVQNVANVQTIYAVGVPRMTKIIVPDSPVWSNQATTNSTQRLYVLGAANSTQGHIATPSGVATGGPISIANAIQGHIAIPAANSILARTFPFAGITAMLVSPPTMSQNLAEASAVSFFGSRLGGTGIAAIQVGVCGAHPNTPAVAYRFIAEKTAAVSAVKVLTQGGTGLTFGSPLWEMRILKDNGLSSHLPLDSQRSGVTTVGNQVTYTGTSAHVGAVSDVFEVSGRTSGIATFAWSSGAPVLTANLTYHAEIRSCHADPGNNYASLQTLFTSPSAAPSQPGFTDAEMGVSRRTVGGAWSAREQNTPQFGVYYVGDASQGQGYRDSLISPLPSITGPLNKVRQTFVPNQDLRVHKIGYRVALWSGGRPLEVRIRRESDSAVLASAVAHVSYFTTANQTDPRPDHRWHYNAFVSSFSLLADVTASLEFSTTSNAEWRSNPLYPSNALGLSAQFYHGRAEFTNDGSTWQPILSTLTAESDLQFYFALGSAAAGPTCQADTISNVVVGQLRTVSAQELIANDTNPSGHSATSTLPTGTNPLTIVLANSASNCTATLVTASQTIRVTAATTAPGAFTYVAEDIYGQRSSARVSFVAVGPSIPTSAASSAKEIWLTNFSLAAALNASVMARYNASTAPTIYWSYLPDLNDDGRWDGKTANFFDANSGLGKVSAAHGDGLVFLDWEAVPQVTYVSAGSTTNMPRICAGFGGSAASRISQAEYMEALDGWRSERPDAQYGLYWLPHATVPINFLTPSSTMENQAALCRTLYGYVDVICPRHYCNYSQGSVTNSSDEVHTVTEADLITYSENMARISLKCKTSGANVGPRSPKVMPFCSRFYYKSGSEIDFTQAPLEWVYKHIKYFCRYTRDGVGVDGVVIWDGSGVGAGFNESHLKAVYQGVNNLPYDPNMPRP
jgi:hypothetical protein